MPTELLAQVVEELSIANAGMHYSKPRRVDRPKYLTSSDPTGPVNAHASAIDRLLASAPARPPRGVES